MTNVDQKWVVKNDEGQILGPFTTAEIIKQINRGVFSGEEMISFYPEINWKSITEDLTFYDELLKVLSDQVDPSDHEEEEGFDSEQSIIVHDFDRQNSETGSDPIADPKNEGNYENSKGEGIKDSSLEIDIPTIDEASQSEVVAPKKKSTARRIVEEGDDFSFQKNLGAKARHRKGGASHTNTKNNTKTNTRSQTRSHSRTNTNTGTGTRKGVNSRRNTNAGENTKSRTNYFSQNNTEVIDLKDQSQLDKEVYKKSKALPFFILFLFLSLVGVWLYMPTSKKTGRIRLLMPSEKITKKSSKQLEGLLKDSISAYEFDSKKNYLKSQSGFVTILEAAPKKHEVWAFLCLVYLELWDYSYQDTKDFRAVSNAVQKASKYNLGGIDASTCQAVDLFLKGRIEDSKSVTDHVLSNYVSQSDPPVVFYYLKALQLRADKDYDVAIGYARSAQKLWPSWLKAYVLEAELHEENGSLEYAAAIYRNILKSNPSHNYSKIKLGGIEYRHYNHMELASQLINSALTSKDLPSNAVVSEAYLNMAEISLKFNNSSEAISYAKKSYALNPLNVRAKKIILSVEGKGTLDQLKLDVREMIYEGDQYFRQSDYETALAHYKSAYEIDPKSATAALKAAKCMWNLSFSESAIQWLNKAVSADPKLLESYTTLARYHADRLDFTLAGKILQKANAVSPNSYEVFQGFSYVELKRHSFQGAIKYAQRALKIYETDIESYVILSEAYHALSNFQEAYASAAKAIEIDPNHKKAQAIYAKALGGLQGVDVGVSYATDLVSKFPLVPEYRYVLGELLYLDDQYIESEKVLKQLIDIDNKFHAGFLLLGKALKVQQKYEEAIEVYFQAALLNPADATSLFEAALVYIDMKKLKKAKVQLERVLNVNNRYTNAHYHLGQIALLQSRYDEALQQADEEIKLNPNVPASYLLKAETYLSMRKYSLCAREYQKAISMAPLGARSYIRVAKCYRLSGNLDAAIQMIKQASRIESGEADIYKEQGAIFETQGESELAIESYEQYLILAPNAPDKGQIDLRIRKLGGG